MGIICHIVFHLHSTDPQLLSDFLIDALEFVSWKYGSIMQASHFCVETVNLCYLSIYSCFNPDLQHILSKALSLSLSHMSVCSSCRWFAGMHILPQDCTKLRALCWLSMYWRGPDRSVGLSMLCVCSGAHWAPHTYWWTQSQPQHLPGGGPCLAKVNIKMWEKESV